MSSMSNAAAARANALRQQGSIADIICPVNGVRDAMKRRGVVPKNHMKENHAMIRSLEKQHKLREQLSIMHEQQAAHAFKLKEFADVQPRAVQAAEAAHAPDGKTHSFLHKGEGHTNATLDHSDGAGAGSAGSFSPVHSASPSRPTTAASGASQSTRVHASTKPPVPRASEAAATTKPRAQHNFVRENKSKALALQPPATARAQSAVETAHTLNPDYGRVPEYIRERVTAAAAARARAEQEERERAEQIPGMRLLPEEERVATLAALESEQTSLNEQLARFPMLADTMALRHKKGVIERRLQELERHLTMFRRAKVYVDLNA